MNENKSLIPQLILVVAIFAASFVIGSNLDTGIAFAFLLLGGVVLYLMRYKNEKGFSSLVEAFEDRKNAYLEKMRTDRQAQIVTVVGVLLTCLMVNQWWNTPRRVRLKIYESIGSVSSLCDFYDAAYKAGDKILVYETADALSKFASEESRAFLGEKLVSDTNMQIVHALVSSLSKNDSDSFVFIINSYKNKKDAGSLIGLFKALKTNLAATHESHP